jgi:hypothetical protein
MSKAYEPRLKTKYREQIRAKLQDQFNYSNPMMIPKLDKVVINMGVGEAVADSRRSSRPWPSLSGSPARSRLPRRPASRSQASSSAKAC